MRLGHFFARHLGRASASAVFIGFGFRVAAGAISAPRRSVSPCGRFPLGGFVAFPAMTRREPAPSLPDDPDLLRKPAPAPGAPLVDRRRRARNLLMPGRCWRPRDCGGHSGGFSATRAQVVGGRTAGQPAASRGPFLVAGDRIVQPRRASALAGRPGGGRVGLVGDIKAAPSQTLDLGWPSVRPKTLTLNLPRRQRRHRPHRRPAANPMASEASAPPLAHGG